LPKRYTQEQRAELLNRLESGEQLDDVCRTLNIARRTVIYWTQREPEFKEAFTLATDQQTPRKAAYIVALEKNLGVLSTACKAAGVSKTTIYNWMKADPNFREQVEGVQDYALDFVESKLFGAINNGNVVAAIFYLKTKGKARGYVERQEFAGVDGGPLNISLNLTKEDLVSDDTREDDPEETEQPIDE
jgi:hypothetical protein